MKKLFFVVLIIIIIFTTSIKAKQNIIPDEAIRLREEARKIIKDNINELDSNVKKVLEKEKYNKNYTISYGQNYFPEKEYKGVKYKEGYYESLVITLGEGEGNNWWCVLFPPLCLVEAEEADEVEYKFFIKELIDKYL